MTEATISHLFTLNIFSIHPAISSSFLLSAKESSEKAFGPEVSMWQPLKAISDVLPLPKMLNLDCNSLLMVHLCRTADNVLSTTAVIIGHCCFYRHSLIFNHSTQVGFTLVSEVFHYRTFVEPDHLSIFAYLLLTLGQDVAGAKVGWKGSGRNTDHQTLSTCSSPLPRHRKRNRRSIH